MASLMETLTQSITPNAASGLGKELGLSQDQLKQGLGVVGPLLQGTMAKAASTPQGMGTLMQNLGKVQEAQAGGTFEVGKFIGNFAQGAGSKNLVTNMLGSILGSGSATSNPVGGLLGGLAGNGLGAIGKTLDKTLGFPVSSLISVVGPALMGILGKEAKDKNLDASGVAKLLGDESKAFMEKGGDTVALVQKALQAGDEANNLRARYTDQEWSSIRLAPIAAARLVMDASPSKGGGAAQEMAAAMAAIAKHNLSSDATSLIGVAFDNPVSENEIDTFKSGAGKDQMLGSLTRVKALLDVKQPTALNSYRTLIMDVANSVAEAVKEGGFMGLGGKAVSPEEEAALAQIKAAIDA